MADVTSKLLAHCSSLEGQQHPEATNCPQLCVDQAKLGSKTEKLIRAPKSKLRCSAFSVYSVLMGFWDVGAQTELSVHLYYQRQER